MAIKKEPLEIGCSGCDTRFRLWVPEEMAAAWRTGARVNCVRCGAGFIVTRTEGGFEVTELKAEAVNTAIPEAEPVAPPAIEAPKAPEPEPLPSVQPDTVLFIDDDRLSREMAEQSLKEIGFNLMTLKNANEALRILHRDGEHVRLLVTDLYLKNPKDPDSTLDGETLLLKVVEQGLHIPAIVTTGKDIIDDLVLDPKWFHLHVKGFIQKGNPFWMDDLKLKIREVLYRG